MRRITALLLLLLLALLECGGKSVPAPQKEELEGAEASSRMPPSSSAPASYAASKPPEKEPSPSSGSFFLPGEAVLLEHSAEKAVWELRLPHTQAVNFILLPEGMSAKAAAVFSGEEALYRSLPGSDSRLLRFDTVQAAALTLLLEAPQGEGVPQAGLLPGKTALCAYLPASTRPELLDTYAASLKRLSQVTVITGICWDESGQVVIIDENYPALLEKLCSLREQYGFLIASTLYPARALVREGRAGAVTEENREALTGAILSHAGHYRLDGIDLDWETPTDSAEWESCSRLIAALGEKKKEGGLSLSAALYPENTGKLSPAAMAALDRLHLMSYDQFDFLGRHATFEGMASDIRQALQAGWRPGQISVGIPAYGRPLDRAAAWPLYCDQPLPLESNLSGDSYFNSPQMVRDKAAYCQLSGFSGAFFFHLTGDLPADAPFSLLAAAD